MELMDLEKLIYFSVVFSRYQYISMVYSMISSENIAENLEKFERFQEEEYAKLCLQLEVSIAKEYNFCSQLEVSIFVQLFVFVNDPRCIHLQRFHQNWF